MVEFMLEGAEEEKVVQVVQEVLLEGKMLNQQGPLSIHVLNHLAVLTPTKDLLEVMVHLVEWVEWVEDILV